MDTNSHPSNTIFDTRNGSVKPSFSNDVADEGISTRGINTAAFSRMFRRRLPLILGVFSIVFGLGALRASKAPPIYQGGFRILIEPASSAGRISDPSVLTRSDGAEAANFTGIDYPTQIEILKSQAILSDIAERVKNEFPDFSQRQIASGIGVERIAIARGRGFETGILEVTYQDSNPDIVRLVLEQTAARYLVYSLEERRNRFSEGVLFIQEQTPILQERVNFLQDQIQQLQEQFFLTSPDTEGDLLSTQLQTLETQQNDAQRQLLELRALYSSLQAQLELNPQEALIATALSGNPQYQALLTQLNEIESQIAIESARFDVSSPAIQALQRRKQNLVSLISQEVQSSVGAQAQTTDDVPKLLTFQDQARLGLIQQLLETTNQIQVLEVRTQKITDFKNTINRRASEFPRVNRRYQDLTRELQLATRTLDQLLVQQETLRVEAAQDQIPWELITNPGNPRRVSSIDKDLILAFVTALAAGVGLAFIWDSSRNQFYSTEDIQDAIQVPVLGVIPFCNLTENVVRTTSLYEKVRIGKEQARLPLFLESFTSLYASICLSMPGVSALKSLVIYSSSPGDGKSTVASYLANAVAESGRKVLLVDANLRAPSLQIRFQVPNREGLIEVLSGTISEEEAIIPSSINENLYILPSGRCESSSTRMLASKHMQNLMEKLEKSFDFVIYDTPNFIGLKDASFLGAFAGGMIMVVGAKYTKRSVALQVLEELKGYHMPILGVVANHPTKASDRYSSLGYYQRQYNQALKGRQLFTEVDASQLEHSNK